MHGDVLERHHGRVWRGQLLLLLLVQGPLQRGVLLCVHVSRVGPVGGPGRPAGGRVVGALRAASPAGAAPVRLAVHHDGSDARQHCKVKAQCDWARRERRRARGRARAVPRTRSGSLSSERLMRTGISGLGMSARRLLMRCRCAQMACLACSTAVSLPASSAPFTNSTQWSVMPASCSSASFFSLSVRCFASHTSLSRSTSCLPRVLIAFVSLHREHSSG